MARKPKRKESDRLRETMRASGRMIVWGAIAFLIGWSFDTSVGQHDAISRIADPLFTYDGPFLIVVGVLKLFSD